MSNFGQGQVEDPGTIFRSYGASAEIGQKGRFSKVSNDLSQLVVRRKRVTSPK